MFDVVKFGFLNDFVQLFRSKLVCLKLLEKCLVNPQMLQAREQV